MNSTELRAALRGQRDICSLSNAKGERNWNTLPSGRAAHSTAEVQLPASRWKRRGVVPEEVAREGDMLPSDWRGVGAAGLRADASRRP
jgi:hypothetical protein